MTEQSAVALDRSTAGDIVAFVKSSSRAKRPRLEICPYGTVTLVAPRRFGAAHWRQFVFQNTSWIKRTLAKVENHRRAEPHLHTLEPTTIELPALGESWPVQYADGHRGGVVEHDNGEARLLIVRIPLDGNRLKYLQAWVRRRARATLPARVRALSQETGLTYSRVNVRAQKTRWGSCTREGVISLNQNLLFLRPELADYLIIHELCHTVHMSHSARYWNLVKRFAPGYQRYESELRHAAHLIPRWAVTTELKKLMPEQAIIRIPTDAA